MMAFEACHKGTIQVHPIRDRVNSFRKIEISCSETENPNSAGKRSLNSEF